MEKPILFNTAMVQAILEGRKTQTRRIIKQQPTMYDFGTGGNVLAFLPPVIKKGWKAIGVNRASETTSYLNTPYSVGDILWVRETWTTMDNFKNYADLEIDKDLKYLYKCDDNGEEHTFVDVGVKKWRPSIHMPKVAARIFLKVTSVKVERLQDITEDGAKSEGIRGFSKDGELYKYSCTDEFNWRDAPRTAKEAFEKLWDSCYKWPKTWVVNPWVWVIEFQKVEGR